jgi:magnesium-transporting ATPase (P-type)
VHLPNGTIRLYTKGASELLLKDCTKVFDAATGQTKPLTPEVNAQLEKKISDMADAALRTLVLAHRDFPSEEAMPPNWATCPPELDMDMVCDCIVGIQDPLRPDVTAAVATARRAGVVVRMVTGDNIQTAKAIARQCGILTEGGR